MGEDAGRFIETIKTSELGAYPNDTLPISIHRFDISRAKGVGI